MKELGLDLKVILGGKPTKKHIKGVIGVDDSISIRVIAFIGITRDKRGIIKRGIGVNYRGGILFFQATNSENPLHYWCAIQIIERLWCLDERMIKEAIAAGEHSSGIYDLSGKCGDSISDQFHNARTDALKVELSEEGRVKIEQELLNPRALLPENLNFSNYRERGGISTHHMPAKEQMSQLVPLS